MSFVKKIPSSTHTDKLVSISALGERYKSMWTSTLGHSDCRGSCSSFTTHLSPLAADHLRPYDVSPQWQFITANGPEVILYPHILGTLDKRFYGIFKVWNAPKKSSLNSKIESLHYIDGASLLTVIIFRMVLPLS